MRSAPSTPANGLHTARGLHGGCAMTGPTETDPMGPNGAVSFETDVKPLFRERDRRSMTFMFDLWAFDDVNEHADDPRAPPRRHDAVRRCLGGLGDRPFRAVDRT